MIPEGENAMTNGIGHKQAQAKPAASKKTGKKDPKKHERMVLPHGQLFRERWEATIVAEHARARHTWWRKAPLAGWPRLARYALGAAARRLSRRA